jgi:hypothetical protein
MADHGPVFVVGAPRSGTSLLQWLLSGHPDLAYADLGLERLWAHRAVRALERLGLPLTRSRLVHRRFLPRPGATAYEPSLAFLGLDPELPDEGLFLWFDRSLRVEPEQLTCELLRREPRAAARIRARYRNVASRSGKQRFVDKSPSFTVMLPAIRELFPDAHVVHIIRDGRAVVNSVAYRLEHRPRGAWWGPPPPDADSLLGLGSVERAAHQWVHLVREGRRGGALFGERYHELRYESLVAVPRVEMGRLQERLRLAPSLERYPERLENRNYKWQERGIASFGDSIWTDCSAIAPADYQALEVMRPLLEELGYVASGAALAAG